jgi:hypothetical protein
MGHIVYYPNENSFLIFITLDTIGHAIGVTKIILEQARKVEYSVVLRPTIPLDFETEGWLFREIIYCVLNKSKHVFVLTVI